MNAPQEPATEREANRVAGRFLRSEWNDGRVPAVVRAKGAYGEDVWRLVARQDQPGRPAGTLTLDIDVATGIIIGVAFRWDR